MGCLSRHSSPTNRFKNNCCQREAVWTTVDIWKPHPPSLSGILGVITTKMRELHDNANLQLNPFSSFEGDAFPNRSSAGGVLGKNIWGGLAPLNFPSPPLFPSPPYPLNFPSHPSPPSLPFPPSPPFPFPLPALSYFLISSFPSLSPFLPLPPLPLEVGPLKSS